MKVGDLVRANKFANWGARQSPIGCVIEIIRDTNHDLLAVRALLGGKIKFLPVSHFKVLS